MDYTLAQYLSPSFDRLAYNGAVDKLIERSNYPEELRGFEFEKDYFSRGLIIDTKRGNFLKVSDCAVGCMCF